MPLVMVPLYTLLIYIARESYFSGLHIGTEHLMIDAGSDWGKFYCLFFLVLNLPL
jgi:hypothetical protein